MRPEDTEMIANICSFERMEAPFNKFQPFKAPGPRRALSSSATERLESIERILPRHFSSMPETQLLCHQHGKKAQVYFFQNPERKAIMKLSPSV